MEFSYEVEFNLSRNGTLTGEQTSVRGGFKGKPSEALRSYLEVFKRKSKWWGKQGLQLSRREFPKIELDILVHFESQNQIDMPRWIRAMGSWPDSYQMTKRGFVYAGLPHGFSLVDLTNLLTKELNNVDSKSFAE